jgi:hypothetical protein
LFGRESTGITRKESLTQIGLLPAYLYLLIEQTTGIRRRKESKKEGLSPYNYVLVPGRGEVLGEVNDSLKMKDL